MSCLYDWQCGFRGERLCCVAHRHGASGSTVIVRGGADNRTLEEMRGLDVLTGQAAADAEPKRGAFLNVHGVVIMDDDIPF